MAIKKVGVSGSAESRLKVTDDKGKAAKDFKKFQKDVGGKARPAAKPSTTKGNPEADRDVTGGSSKPARPSTTRSMKTAVNAVKKVTDALKEAGKVPNVRGTESVDLTLGNSLETIRKVTTARTRASSKPVKKSVKASTQRATRRAMGNK